MLKSFASEHRHFGHIWRQDMSDQHKSLYERLGGPAHVAATVNMFYSRVLTDKTLHDFFDDLPMDEQVEKQTRFLIRAFGGPTSGQLRSLRETHQKSREKGMTATHFDAVVAHLAATLKELKTAEDLIAEVLTRIESTRADVLGE